MTDDEAARQKRLRELAQSHGLRLETVPSAPWPPEYKLVDWRTGDVVKEPDPFGGTLDDIEEYLTALKD